MEWQLIQDILSANAKQLPAVVLMGAIIVVLWKVWGKERAHNKKLYEARISDLKAMLRSDDSSDS